MNEYEDFYLLHYRVFSSLAHPNIIEYSNEYLTYDEEDNFEYLKNSFTIISKILLDSTKVFLQILGHDDSSKTLKDLVKISKQYSLKDN